MDVVGRNGPWGKIRGKYKDFKITKIGETVQNYKQGFAMNTKNLMVYLFYLVLIKSFLNTFVH